ncbi:MAG: alpha/beta hydrolase [Acidimicrobiia bacterium]|nr:alpha/beta hydrolase [Acidimicrobiia bacterium]
MFLDVDGVRLNVVSFGSGTRTFVATGGWTGSWELWQQPFELLTAVGWHCVSYDHRGSGESPVEPQQITVDKLVDDTVGVMDALGIETCVIGGESMGGAIAQLAVSRYTDRFTGLVLVDATDTDWHEGDARSAARSRADYAAVVPPFVDTCIPEPDSEHVRRWGRHILMRAEPEQAARLIEMWGDRTIEFDAGRIAVPTLIIHGAEDKIAPIDYSRRLSAQIPDVELIVLDDTGHVPTLTRPRAVAEAIDRRFPS